MLSVLQRVAKSVVKVDGETVGEIGRGMLVLVGVEGFSYQEAAEMCGCAVGTVKSRINRARNRFRQLIKPMLKNETLLQELERIEARAAEEKNDDF